MPSQEKLIKQGIKYTDSLFAEVSKRIEQGVLSTDTLEAFLDKYHKAYPDNGNPLVTLGYDKEMIRLILSETNNHKFTRPSQKELVRVTIENRVGENIVDVGDEIRDSVRDIVKDGYNNRLSQDEIAENISGKVSSIKNRRARAIARTEIARAATVSDYIINKEMGATHFYVECRNTACPVCKEAWHNKWTPENNDSFSPSDTSAGGKGWIGDKTYSMNDTKMLPPLHPNCRCVPYFINDGKTSEKVKSQKTTAQTKKQPTTQVSDNSMMKGKPKITYETDKLNGARVTVYEYESGFQVAINDGARFTIDEIADHIQSLPEPLRTIDGLNRISIRNYSQECGGYFKSNENIIEIFGYNSNKSTRLDTLNHELAHALDYSKRGKGSYDYGLSKPEIYDKIFKEDNKVHSYINETTGRRKTPKLFPTDYAKRNFVKYKKQFQKHFKIWEKSTKTLPKPRDFRYGEDFADSTKLYLNPKTHSKFVKDFPNRAEYLESIYGKPQFKKDSVHSKLLQEEEDAELKRQKRKERIESITDEEIQSALLDMIGEENTKKYLKAKNELEKVTALNKAIQDAHGYESTEPLTKLGYSQKESERIMQNLNENLSKTRKRRDQLRAVVDDIESKVKEVLADQPAPKTTKTVSPIEEVEKPKKQTKQKTTSDTKQTKTKKVSKKSETKNIDPIERASIKNISYEEYPHMDFKAPKTIEYEDGTIIKFKPKVTNPEAPDWTEQTLDEITINGRTIKYKNSDKIYDDFKYIDSQLTKEELEFADEFAERYGTYAGQEFNNLKRGRISEEDLEFIKDDENYKWLNKNYEKYNKILDKCEIQEDIVTMRIQHKNYVKKGSKQIQDKGYTSTSAGVPRTNLFSDFGNARDMSDNWTFITVTPKGTKGARFHGNSLARRYGSQDEDFEKEVLYKMNKKFDILLWDEKNKIMILEAR